MKREISQSRQQSNFVDGDCRLSKVTDSILSHNPLDSKENSADMAGTRGGNWDYDQIPAGGFHRRDYCPVIDGADGCAGASDSWGIMYGRVIDRPGFPPNSSIYD